MPVHDWTRVDDGVFHDVHGAWITELRRALNGGILPASYYSMGEQVLGGGNPDVLALERGPLPRLPAANGPPDTPEPAGVALLTAPPQTRVVARAVREAYTRNQRRLVIRHGSDHRLVAIIEIVSAGNKASQHAWFTFLNKVLAALYRGIHLLLVDLHPPTVRDPQGIHGAVWGELTGEAYTPPTGLDRTLVSYSAGLEKTAYVEPLAVGDHIPDMPLFLTPDGDGHVMVPLETTYQAAYAPLDEYYRRILEAPAA